MNKLPSFSVNRPILTTMVTLIIVIIGGVSLHRLQIDLLPTIEMPTLTIRTDYEGASPEVVERMVTQFIEEIIGTVPGVEEMTSQSSEGSSSVRVTFAWGTNIDTAAMDVQSRIDDEINELPDGILRPRIRKFDIASFPVVVLGVSSRLDPVELTGIIENQVKHHFAHIPGVAQVDIFGGFEREIRIELLPDRLKAYSLSLDLILNAIRDANLDLPAGKINDGNYEVTLRAPAEFTDTDQIMKTVLLKHDGAVITLGQIAEVRDTYRKLSRIIRVNGERGIRLAIRKQANANTVEVSRRVLQEISAVNETFPQLKIIPVINQGNFIERSIANVARSVLYGGGLAILILLFFLRNVRSTIIISMAIPISIVATFALMYFGGLTLNLMTLGGLALGVGMMVDSSIVVLENIFRRRAEHGESIAIAAVEGTNEVGSAIIAGTITTLVIFLPLVFVRGVSGILFKELAYVIVFSLLCSLLLSLSLVPMLASRIISDGVKTRSFGPTWINRLATFSETVFEGLTNQYRRVLGWVTRHHVQTIVIALVLFFASLMLYPAIGTEFLPPSDEGEVRVTGEMEVGTRLDIVDRQSRKMEKIVAAHVPEAVSSVTTVGASGWRADAGSQSEMRLSLLPSSQRKRSNTAIAADLRNRLDGQIAGMTIRTRAPQGQFLLERILGSGEGLTIEVRGFDIDMLNALATDVELAIAGIPGITDVTSSRDRGMPQQEMWMDRKKIADLGLSIRNVSEIIETVMTGRQVGDFRTQGESYRIFVQLKDAENLPLDEILDLALTAGSGKPVLLRNVVTTSRGRSPIVIDRKDQQRQITVTANVAGRDTGSVARDVVDRIDAIPRPQDYSLNVTGNYEQQQESFREMTVALILALMLVYMVMASQYESLRDPFIVMFSVPLAAIGVLVLLFITKTTLNVQSGIGCIMLGGIVVNNAILLVDQTSRLHRRGMPCQEAIIEAGRRRLRPILMTTLTTILGLMPLALGIGEGADAQAPLARAVIGGLTTSTLITLVLIPAIYLLLHRGNGECPALSSDK